MDAKYDLAVDLVREAEAAEMLAVRPQTLRNWRCGRHAKLPFVKIGRAVRYRRADIARLIEASVVAPAK